jgi:hypothetical protein
VTLITRAGVCQHEAGMLRGLSCFFGYERCARTSSD